MQYIISLTDRGTMTLPSSIRKELALTGGQQFIVEVTGIGELLLRPATTIPLEIYSEERIAEFNSQDGALGALLTRYKF